MKSGLLNGRCKEIFFNWIKSNSLVRCAWLLPSPWFPPKVYPDTVSSYSLHMLQNKSAVSNLRTIAYNMEGFKYGIIVDQLSHVEGSSTAIRCEYSNDTASTGGFSVVWILNRNAVISVLASFNGTSRSYQPWVQINQNDFSLMLRDLTADDSGEYLCNISTPDYTKLTVGTLQVENSDNTGKIVLGVIAALVLVAGVCFWVWFKKCRGRGIVWAPWHTGRKYLSAGIPHADATEIAAEKNKEFLHLPYWVTLRATWKCIIWATVTNNWTDGKKNM